MQTGPLSVLLIGVADPDAAAISDDESFDVTRVDALAAAPTASTYDAVVLRLDGAPLESLQRARQAAPDAAVVVLTDGAHAADGTVALHAGAEDHLVRDATLPVLLPRALRYAVGIQQVRRELATVDEATRLPNLRGFAAIGAHYLRMADRLGQPAVFVFVRLEDYEDLVHLEGPGGGDDLARDAAEVILQAVRDSDIPARIAPDTICVLLTGEAEGAESIVLSRLVEAIATHDARRPDPRALSLGVGTARYEPGSGAQLVEILSSAVRGLASQRPA
jgi:diguanylate cyclase (GGDEF)-like protein